MNARTSELSAAGVSIWLDDLSRGLLESGRLTALIETRDVVGVTTNPTIFANAIGAGVEYRDRVAEAVSRGLSPVETVTELVVADVTDACRLLRPVFEASGGADGRVSIEVEPALAHDAEATLARAIELWRRIAEPNLMIKIPATTAGLVAISDALAEGISVNVTLIFGLPRYRQVLNAYLVGLERARAVGHDLSTIRSVASLFVSRLDTEVDRRLDASPDPEAPALLGRAGVANARLAHEVHEQVFATARAQHLLSLGAHHQRLLWASTGVKDPRLPDTHYVTELVTSGVVNTMPAATLEAVADHAEVVGDTVVGRGREADQVLNALDGFGIEYAELTEALEREGLEKFVRSWDELVAAVSSLAEASR